MSSKEQLASGRDFKRNSNAYASLPATGSLSGTPGKPRSRQQQLETEQYGLSRSLSSESLRQACTYYEDDLSDEDLIEIRQTPQSFHHPLAKAHLQVQPIAFRMGDGQGNADETSAFCGSQEMQPVSLSTPVKQGVETDEALCVLSELDAILDGHDASQLFGTGSSSGSDDDKVEDYLMDLDNYLEEMDNALSREESLIIMDRNCCKAEPRTRTLPLSMKHKSNMKRGANLEATSQEDCQKDPHIRKFYSCSLRGSSLPGIASKQLSSFRELQTFYICSFFRFHHGASL